MLTAIRSRGGSDTTQRRLRPDPNTARATDSVPFLNAEAAEAQRPAEKDTDQRERLLSMTSISALQLSCCLLLEGCTVDLAPRFRALRRPGERAMVEDTRASDSSDREILPVSPVERGRVSARWASGS